jgi:hypothetical protein
MNDEKARCSFVILSYVHANPDKSRIGGMPRISAISSAYGGIVRPTNFSAFHF